MNVPSFVCTVCVNLVAQNHVLYIIYFEDRAMPATGTFSTAQTVVQVTYSARQGEPNMPQGKSECQIMLTSKDTTPYQKVVQKVEAVFAEVLVDADWILKGAQGQLLTSISFPVSPFAGGVN